MSAIASTAFIIALLLSIGTMESTAPWLVTLAVLTGICALRPGSYRRRPGRELPFMMALTSFIIALLLALEALEPTGSWLVTLTVLTGMLAFMPPRSSRWPVRRLRGWVGAVWAGDDA